MVLAASFTGSLTLDLNIVLQGNGITVSSGGELAIDGVVSGSNGLSLGDEPAILGQMLTGGGTLNLEGNNTYTGGTLVETGQLDLNGIIDSNIYVCNGVTFNLTGTVFGTVVDAGDLGNPYSTTVSSLKVEQACRALFKHEFCGRCRRVGECQFADNGMGL